MVSLNQRDILTTICINCFCCIFYFDSLELRINNLLTLSSHGNSLQLADVRYQDDEVFAKKLLYNYYVTMFFRWSDRNLMLERELAVQGREQGRGQEKEEVVTPLSQLNTETHDELNTEPFRASTEEVNHNVSTSTSEPLIVNSIK